MSRVTVFVVAGVRACYSHCDTLLLTFSLSLFIFSLWMCTCISLSLSLSLYLVLTLTPSGGFPAYFKKLCRPHHPTGEKKNRPLHHQDGYLLLTQRIRIEHIPVLPQQRPVESGALHDDSV